MSLSEQQRMYVDTIGSTVLCACPGSGKTFAVAEKAKKHMNSWSKSHSGIAVLSFTNVAIEEIKKAVMKECIISYPHYFGTVDSFIDDVFLRFASYDFDPPHRPYITFDYVDPLFRWKSECYKNGCVKDIASFHWNIDYELFKDKQKVTCSPGSCGLTPCERYKKGLLRRGIVYQIDVPMLCTRMLKKHPQVAQAIAKRYPIIIIDEAQDTSKEQMAFFDFLCENGLVSIDFVGDPDQSIYEWRNATPECFIEKMNNGFCRTVYLSENRRSSQLICNATSTFSKVLEGKPPSKSVGEFRDYPQKPQLLLLSENKTEEHAQYLFIQKCEQLGIMHSAAAILTRRKIHSERDVKDWNKTQEVKLFANAAFEWQYGKRSQAYQYCEQALYTMFIGDLVNQSLPLEQEIEHLITYQEWKRTVISVLTGLYSADTALSEWIVGLKTLLNSLKLPLPFREGHDINTVIKIKKNDNEQPDFRSKAVKCFFQNKETDTIVRSSIHGVKGETFDAVLLLALSIKGNNTITRNLLCHGDLDCEMMRTAYVAMTRPRKYLAVAIRKPMNASVLQLRFPDTQWEYIHI